MYTDDLVLLAENGDDLQCLLDELITWHNIWGVKMNEQKSKVIHFRMAQNVSYGQGVTVLNAFQMVHYESFS